MKTSHDPAAGGGIGLKLAVALAILAAALTLAWITILPLAVAKAVRLQTGFDTEIQSLYCNPFTGDLAVRGLVITNPPAFPAKDFLTIREFRAHARLASLFSRHWEIDDAALNVALVAVVRDQHGAVNARLFQRAVRRPATNQPPAGASTAAPAREFLIRHLEVKIDRLVVADYSLRTPEVREFNLNFRHTYDNVTSVQQLAAPLVDASASLSQALKGVIPEIGTTLHRAGATLKETGRKAGEAVKSFFETLEKSLRK